MASDLSWRRKMVSKHGEVATFAARCTEVKNGSFLLDWEPGATRNVSTKAHTGCIWLSV